MKQNPLNTNEVLRILNDYQIQYKAAECQYYVGKRKVSLQTLAVGLQNLGFSVPETKKLIAHTKFSFLSK